MSLLRERERQNLEGVHRYTMSFCKYAARHADQYAIHVNPLLLTVEETAVDPESHALHIIQQRIDELLSYLREIHGEWEHELVLRQQLGLRLTATGSGRMRLAVHSVGHPFVDIMEQQLYALHSSQYYDNTGYRGLHVFSGVSRRTEDVSLVYSINSGLS